MFKPNGLLTKEKGAISPLLFVFFLVSVLAFLITSFYVLKSTNFFESLAVTDGDCFQQLTKEDCENRSCINSSESCYWSENDNTCYEKPDRACENLSLELRPCDSFACPPPRCDSTTLEKEENDKRCAENEMSGSVYCPDFRLKYCCNYGEKWTEYDQKCCDPENIVTFWNPDFKRDTRREGDSGYGDIDYACGCPEGMTCWR